MNTQSASQTPPKEPTERCRLVLIVNGETCLGMKAQDMQALVNAGDMASVIFTSHRTDGKVIEESEWQPALQPLVTIAQEAGIAVIIDTHSRIAGRVGADGLQFGQDPQALEEAIERYTPKLMVGAANVKTRHNALVLGELQPDYIMFGKAGGDIRPEPHPKNLDLGQWWSAIVEIPCIVLGGSAVESVVDVAKTGADFVALSTAIFMPQEQGKEDLSFNAKQACANITKANALLDEHAPRFELDDD